MTIKNGDLPAMPVKGNCVDASGAYCGDVVYSSGISKREQFAAMAMQGFCSNLEYLFETCPSGTVVAEWIARQSLFAADHLLIELERTK